MKPILWVFIIFLVQQAICAPQKLGDSEKIENDDEHQRSKRASRNGQTQSQYLNFGDSQTEGKADAEITRYGSRASVSGSNGMGQAQSQSSGSGCDECYGSEGSYSNGAAHGPDPLRSSSGAGISQSHGMPQSPSGYDAYGRPYTLPSSGYSSQGFGESPTRGPSNLKDLQTFGNGYPSTGGSIPQNGVLSVTPTPITVSTNPAGNVYQNTRGHPSNVGGTSFLNRPISNGKAQPIGGGVDHTTRPSILAGRKTFSSNLDNNKLVDGSDAPGLPSSFGSQPTSRMSTPNYGRTGSNLPDSSLPPQKTQPTRGFYDTRVGTREQTGPYDTLPSTPPVNGFDRSKTSSIPGSASYDRTFHKPPVNNGDLSKPTTDSISHPSSMPSLSQISSQQGISTPIIPPESSVSTYGNRIQSSADRGSESAISQPETDSLSKLRNVFKLPPGLCLVRCDTLKPGQYSLTPEQIRDAFIASGLIDQRGGPSQVTDVSTVPSQSSKDLPQYQPPGSGAGSQFSQGFPQYQPPSSGVGPPFSQGFPQHQPPSTGAGSQFSQGFPQYQPPSSGAGSQFSQGLPQYQPPSSGVGPPFSQGLPQYQPPSSGAGSQFSQGFPQYQPPSNGAESQFSPGLPHYQSPSREAGSEFSQGLPQYQPPSSGVGSPFSQGLQQYQPPISGAGSPFSQGLPQYQPPSSGVGSPFSQGLPLYQQNIPQGSVFPHAGLPSYTIPSANQFTTGSTIPSPSNLQPISQPGQVFPSGSYQANVPSLGYPTIATIPQGHIHQLPTPTQFTSTGQFGAGQLNQPVSLSQTASRQYPVGTQPQQGPGQFTQGGQGILSGPATQGLFPSGTGQVSSPGYINPPISGIYTLPDSVQVSSTPGPISSVSAGNLFYGGGDGSSSSGSSQTGDVDVSSENAGVDEDGHSQAQSSIKNGVVVASAQGTKNGGTAQTQVEGSYSGAGSFSASAQTQDKDRAAQAQVSGNKDTAQSSSQGSGGKSKAQSQVKVDEKTGGTSASGQSSGAKHSSQSEVIANEKGGLADAQSSGPGQTSSQAQIGFRPEGTNANPSGNIFSGGGEASAQSGVHSGQSQSQIQGSFKYGISYHGAAQAASGTKDQVSSYRENSKKLFQSIGQFSRSNRGPATQAPPSDIANINEIGLRPLSRTSAVAADTLPDESGLDDEDYTEMNDEGENENNYSPDPSKQTKTRTSRVEIELPKRVDSASTEVSKEIETTTSTTVKIENKIAESAKLIRMPAVRSEIIPDGFKGKIGEKRQPLTINQIDFDKKIDVKPDTYVTVTKSVSGSLDNSKVATDDDKKFESTYYTKTSTCGYFTFSCNIVYGSNGRSKICRPKAPENGKC